jgi:hypothetical protein
LEGNATRLLDSALGSWSKSSFGNIRFYSEGINLEFSTTMGELVSWQFNPRPKPELPSGTTPLSTEEAKQIAKKVLGAQLDGYWQCGEVAATAIDETGVEVQIRIARNGIPYATQSARIAVSRITGCVSSIQKSFSFLPRIAVGDGISVSSEGQAVLRAIALDAYERWRPLDFGTEIWAEVSYNIPHWERHDNEMTEQHRQLSAEKKLLPVFRLSIQGSRDVKPYLVAIYVDALARKPIAIVETPLDENLGAGSPRDLPTIALQDFKFLDGRKLEAQAFMESAERIADRRLLTTTRGLGLVLWNVDLERHVIWTTVGREGRTAAFRVVPEAWSALKGELEKRRPSFGHRDKS